MLPIDPGDGPGSPLPGGQQPPAPFEGPPGGKDRNVIAITPAQAFSDIVPPQALTGGSTIIRPGAVAWGGPPDARDGGYSSCEVIERTLAAVARNPGELPSLLAELAASRLWVVLPPERRPFTDGAAVRLPLIGYQGDDFVPCFTSVQRLTVWASAAEAAPDAVTGEPAGTGGAGRSWQRAGDPRVVPHIVVPAIGLARRMPFGVGLAINPDSVPGLPIYPECVPYLARLTAPAILALADVTPRGAFAAEHQVPGTGIRFLIGHPPAEPTALLAETRAMLGALRDARQASRAWLSVPGQGEGLVISVVLEDPESEEARTAVAGAIDRAVAAVPLRVPFPVDLTFPGEPGAEAPGTSLTKAPFPSQRSPGDNRGSLAAQDAIDSWIATNTRPFYTRE